MKMKAKGNLEKNCMNMNDSRLRVAITRIRLSSVAYNKPLNLEPYVCRNEATGMDMELPGENCSCSRHEQMERSC